MLSMKELEAQSAQELPNRDLMALINVLVLDVVDVGDVFLPVGVAANLRDINAAALVADFQDAGEATCTAVAQSPGQGGNPNR